MLYLDISVELLISVSSSLLLSAQCESYEEKEGLCSLQTVHYNPWFPGLSHLVQQALCPAQHS